MKIATARKLLAEPMDDMSLEQLQAHRIRLIDAWRESKAEYGIRQAVRDGFYKLIASDSAKGYSPTDVWLTVNLNARVEEACKKEISMFYADKENRRKET